MTGVLSPYTADKQRSDQALQFLVKASEILSSSLDLDFTMDALAWLVVPELADWCLVSVVESSGARAISMAHKDAATVEAGRQVAKGRFDDPDQLARSLGLTSILTVPLKAGAETLGEMTLAMIERRVWSDAEVALADRLGNRAGVALLNARLYQDAVGARNAAEDANAAKVEFLARMSHELRTPLNAIGGFADLLAMGLRGALTPQQSEDVRRIQRNQIHLQSLISDILNYAKLEVGRLEFDMKPTPVRGAVSAVEQVYSKQFDAAGIAWTSDFDGPLWVLADLDKLQQILMNLVSNAMKFTPTGGRIGIRGRARGEMVEVTITDSGPGIPADKIEVIFEPFVQITRAGEVPTGTGLGLAIARDLARGMGGELRAEPVASGASFVLRLRKAAR
jgi:signal transduction histidine kinase